MSKYIVKDSGKRQDFATGSRRDTNAGKPRYDLISTYALRRIAHHMRRGAEKYGERNWEKGQPIERFVDSGLRHFHQYMQGETTEDHLAAVCYNIMAIIHFEETDGKRKISSTRKTNSPRRLDGSRENARTKRKVADSPTDEGGSTWKIQGNLRGTKKLPQTTLEKRA